MQRSVPYFYNRCRFFVSAGAIPAGLLMAFPRAYFDHWPFCGQKSTLCSIYHEAAQGIRSFVHPPQNTCLAVPIFVFRPKKRVQRETHTRPVPNPLSISLPAGRPTVLYPISVPKNFETGYRKCVRNSVNRGRMEPCRNGDVPQNPYLLGRSSRNPAFMGPARAQGTVHNPPSAPLSADGDKVSRPMRISGRRKPDAACPRYS